MLALLRALDGRHVVETPPQIVSEDEDPIIFSFYNDLTASPDVVQLLLTVTRTIERTFGRVNKQLDQYRKYDQLWKVDKAQHLSKFAQRNPTVVMFDSRRVLLQGSHGREGYAAELEVRWHA